MKYLKHVLWMFLAIVLAACADAESESNPAPDTEAVVVTVSQATTGDMEIIEETVGQIVTIYAPTVSAEIDARVMTVHRDVGDRVRAGDVILELDAKPLDLERQALRAEGASLAAELLQQKRTVRRYENLIGKKHISEDELDAARSKASVLQARHEVVLARIRVLDDRIERASIHAPLDGLVNLRHVDAGDYVKKGDPLFDLVDNQQLRAILPFPETVAGRIKTGARVRLRTNFSDQLIDAQVSDIQPTLFGDTRSLLVLADFINPGNWRAESSVNGRVTIERHSHAVLVDAAAVVRRPSGDVVYVKSGESAAEKPVRTGARQHGKVEILAGLEAGAEIIVQGAAYLSDGTAVKTRVERP